MPFSSSPVTVNPGDKVQVRYPTPGTWNTQVTVNVQIGTGSDPDGITFGTKIPDALPQSFSFTDQQGFTGAFNGTSTPGSVNVFQRNTTYYSQVVDIASIEIPIPASISAVSNGPKNSNTNNTSAQFRIYRNGAFDSWRTSISANVNNGTGGLQPGDKVQLRVTVPDWYVTSTLVTFNVGDETFGTNIGQGSTSFSRTWGITTRAQDQDINQYSFTDRVDQKIPADGGNTYHTYNVPVSTIDGDVVLRATSTGNVQISADNSNWSQSIGAQLIQGDTLYTRILNGPGYTTKTTGTLNVFAVGGDTYTRGGNSYENTTGGTYGSGNYQVTQNLGTVEDNWQNWTEVDRYPDPVDAAPIFTYGVKLGLVGTAPPATPVTFVPGQTYNVSGGTGNSMVVKLTEAGFNELLINDPGYGYTIGDIVTITAAGTTVTLEVLEYEKILVSSDNNHNRAEPDVMYFADVPITGLGTEYTSGIYNDLESPYTNLGNNSPATAQNLVAQLNGQGVKMTAIIDGTAGFIRKNNTGSWVQQLTVEENDVVNLKLRADIDFDDTQIATVRLQGPPDGNPSIGNPTGGPSSPTFPEKTFTMTLDTRVARTIPYPFHATPVYLSDPGVEQIAEVDIRGLDESTTATITGGIGSLSVDGVNWGSSVTILKTNYTLFVRQNADTGSGGLAQITYRIGTSADISNGDALFDTFRVYTRQFNIIGDFITQTYFGAGFTDYTEFTIPAFAADDFYLALVGAGGGDGGGDLPASTGGPGGSGNLVRVRVQIPSATWPTNQFGNPDYKLRVYPADAGGNGGDYVVGTGGGTGGFGYAYGGDGGNSGPGDASGGGGGGGGASAITLTDGTLIALAGGGGGGGGAGNDAATPLSLQYGNYNSFGSVSTSTINLNLPGDDAPDRTTGQGGGPGGGGGGYDGSAGTLINSYTEGGTVIQSDDLDSTGGNGGGAYYNPTYATPLSAAAPAGQGAAPGEEGAVYIEYSQQDVTPNSFSFGTTDDATVQETVLSDIVQITGITGTVPVTVSAPGFTADVRICSGPTANTCGAYESSAQIGNGEYVQVRATTGNQFFTTYTVAVTVGDTTANWAINAGPPPDSIPNNFSIGNIDGAPINTLIESEEVTISGITVPVSVTATNGAEVSVEGAAYVPGVPGATIENGEQFRVRINSSSDFEDDVTTQVTVGNAPPVDWVVETAAELDSQPDTYSWLFETGADLLTTYESNTELIQGIETTADFIIEQGPGDEGPNTDLARIIKNGVLLGEGVTSTTVNNFDTLALQYTTSDVVGETRVFNTKLGLASATTGFFETLWSVITAGQFGSDPDDFNFTTALAAGPEVYTEAAETVTISGLANGISVGLYGTGGAQFAINGGAYNTYTVGSQANVSNGDTFTVRILSSGIPGFTRTAFIFAGSYDTGFSVQTPAAVQDPINSQWYSSITPCKYIGNTFSGDQIRVNTKFDGLPVGSIMPVFQDGTESDSWGTLDGKPNSRFPSFVYCDGTYYDPAEYPLLFEVLQYEYGAKLVGSDTYFRVPDFRNRYVKGTGVVDGNSASSPGLTPTFQPSKQSGAPGNEEPGAFGGMWFVDTIGDPGLDELEQVVQPATGQPAQESEYFGIAQVSTSGYSDVSGLIEFFTSGKVTCPVGLDPEKIYDVPLHFHDLISGVGDPGSFKGRVVWGGNGGYGIDVKAPSADDIGSPSVFTEDSSGTFSFNLWGYALEDYDLTADNLPGSQGCGDNVGWWNGSTGTWGSGTDPGYEGIDEVGEYGAVTIQQDGIGGTEYSEINSYIDLDAQPFTGQTGAFGGTNARKFLSSVDIPRKEITVKSYNPTNKLKHNHYVSLTAIPDGNIYGYGNNETGGTTSNDLQNFSGGINSSVDLEFSALDIGIQVLPGTFTLQQTKQLIPVPEFSPQDQVPMVTPYVWTKWMIKAY